jgi:hypothetical protein
VPYTVTKLLIWMILAFLLGILVGWALRTLRARRDVAAARSGATGAIDRPATGEPDRSGRVTVVEPPSEETVSEPVESSSPAIETAAVVAGAPASGGVSDDIVHQRDQMAEYEAELEEISAELDLPDEGATTDAPKRSGADPAE